MDTLPTSFAGRHTRYKSNKKKSKSQPNQQLNHTADIYTNIVIESSNTTTTSNNIVDDTILTTITAADYGLTNATQSIMSNKRFKFTDDTDTPIVVTEPVPSDIKLNAQTIDNEFYATDDIYDIDHSDVEVNDDIDHNDNNDTMEPGDNELIAEFLIAASENDDDSAPDELSSIQWPTALTTQTSPTIKSIDTTVSSEISPYNNNDTPRIPFSNTNATTQQTTTSVASAITSSNVYDDTDEPANDTEQLIHTTQSNKRKRNKNRKQQQSNNNNNSDTINDSNSHTGIHIKYWHQRYRYFSKYDLGIKVDTVGWYSVTPEQIAKHQAQQCAQYNAVIDAFAGVGGNTIQFALQCQHVIAIEIDPVRLACCKHNAKIYGVEDKITFILGDYMQLIPTLQADVVFLSPPWGGPTYSERDTFDIETDIPMNGKTLYQQTKTITNNIVYCLPRNSNMEQIQSLATLPSSNNDMDIVESVNCVIEQNCINKKVKMLTAYYGQFDVHDE